MASALLAAAIASILAVRWLCLSSSSSCRVRILEEGEGEEEEEVTLSKKGSNIRNQNITNR